jgi:uncharacterized protein (DUF111 family)
MPVLPSPVKTELTTPTGAVIIKTLAANFGNIPHMTVEKIGYGIGGKNFKEAPNLLRVILGKGEGAKERLIQMETNIDDM